MSIIINASIDGASYPDITKIITGGKTINLSGTNEGSDLPSNVAQIATGSYTQESDIGATKTFVHGCSGAPDIIILWSDFKTRYTPTSKPQNTTIVGAVYNYPGGAKMYETVGTSYDGSVPNSTAPTATTPGSTDDGNIINVGDATFDVKFVSNRRCGGGLTYQWLAIRLA